MKQFKISLVIFLAIAFAVFCYSNFVLAEGGPEPDQHSYLFHLYYDHGKLTVDRDFPYKYDILLEAYQQAPINTANPYHGYVVSASQKTLATFQFDPQNGSPAFVKGKISVKGPYFANADKVNFYNNQNQLLSSLSVSGSSFCNDNGTCEADLGEDIGTCPSDCRVASPSPLQSITPIPSIVPVSGSTDWTMIILIVVAILAVAGLAVWFIMKNRRNKANDISITLP